MQIDLVVSIAFGATMLLIGYLIGYYHGRCVESLWVECKFDQSVETAVNSYANEINYLRTIVDVLIGVDSDDSDENPEIPD